MMGWAVVRVRDKCEGAVGPAMPVEEWSLERNSEGRARFWRAFVIDWGQMPHGEVGST